MNRPFLTIAIAGTCGIAHPSFGQAAPNPAGNYSIMQQAKELQAIAQAFSDSATDTAQAARINKALTAVSAALPRDSVTAVEMFIKDPLCRQTPLGGWCNAQFNPLKRSNRRLLIPSAELIHSVAVAVAAPNTAFAQGLGDQLTTPLSPSAYTIAAGVSDFVVARAKDELVVTFALDLRDRLIKDAVLHTLFSHTLTATSDMDSRSVKELLPAMRTAFAEDLDSLPLHLADTLVLTGIRDKLVNGTKDASVQAKINKAFAELIPLVGPSVAIGKRIYPVARGTNPLDAIATFQTLTSVEIPATDVRASLILGGLVAREYRDDANGLKSMAHDPRGRELLLALFMKAIDDDMSTNTDLDKWLTALGSTGQGSFVRLVTGADDIGTQIDALRIQVTAAGSASNKAGAATSAIFRMTNEFATLVQPFVTSPTWPKLQAVLSQLNEIQVAVAGKQYLTAAVRTGVFVQENFSANLPSGYNLALNTASAFATATTPEEITAALETSAEPVLSFRAKRTISMDRGRTMFGLNAYAGFAAGGENSFARGVHGSDSWYSGLALPIGPEWSVANGSGSLSLFVPLVDLGAIASFRFSDSSPTQTTPNITFAQIIAPGLYGVIGITQRYPISLGLGAQYVAGLRKSDTGQPMNVVRFGAWLGVDVPLFHF